MKKVYVILSSHGSYGDHHKKVECVCANPIFAEGKKVEIENKYREEIPFPFDWCTEQEFLKLLYEHKVVPEDEILPYLKEYINRYEKRKERKKQKLLNFLCDEQT